MSDGNTAVRFAAVVCPTLSGLAGFATVASADPFEDLDGRIRERPSCFPISDAIRQEVESGRLGELRVMVEERSWCGGEGGAMRSPLPLPGPEIVGLDRLRALLASLPSAPPDGTRYALVPRADGWLVAPVDERVVDTHVSIDPLACPTRYDGEVCARIALTAASGVWFAPGGNPNGCNGTNPLNHTSIVDLPFLEAWIALHTPHERLPGGFVLEVRPAATIASTTARGRLSSLSCRSCTWRDPTEPALEAPAEPVVPALTAPPRGKAETDRRGKAGSKERRNRAGEAPTR